MNIHEFFQASVNALQSYILLHYDRQAWFTEWVGLSDVGKYYENCAGSIGSPYFHFDWTTAGYRHMAKNWTLYRCSKCAVVTSDESCWNCETKAAALTEDEAFDHFRDHRYDIYEQELLDALLIDGWRTFCSHTHPLTNPHRQEVLQCLAAIAQAERPSDQIVHLLWSLKITHHATDSNVIKDYSVDELLALRVDCVRTQGIKEEFGADDVKKFLRGEYPKIRIDLVKIQKDCPPFGEDEWEKRYGSQASEDRPISHHERGGVGTVAGVPARPARLCASRRKVA